MSVSVGQKREPEVKVLVFQDYVLPWDKLCYAERILIDGQPGVRLHLVSYGFFDVAVTFDEFMEQVIDMVRAL